MIVVRGERLFNSVALGFGYQRFFMSSLQVRKIIESYPSGNTNKQVSIVYSNCDSRSIIHPFGRSKRK